MPADEDRTLPRRSFVRSLAVCTILALALRIGYAALLGSAVSTPDTVGYERLAISTHSGKYDAADPPLLALPVDLLRPPLYPLFLASLNPGAVIHEQRTALWQCVLGAFLCMPIGWIVYRLLGDGPALWAAVIYAVDWVTILHTPLLLSETLFTVLLTLSVLFFGLYLKDGRLLNAWIAGACLGAAVLTKPIAQLELIAFVLPCLWLRRSRAGGLVFLMTYSLLVLPWMMRNWSKYGLFTVSDIQTVNLNFYVAHGAVSAPVELGGSGEELAAAAARARASQQEVPMQPAERHTKMKREAWRIILARPGRVAVYSAVGFVRTLLGPGRETFLNGRPVGGYVARARTVLPLAELGGFWLLFLWGTLGPGQRRDTSPELRFLLLGTILLILLPAAPNGYSRFRIPVVPELAVFSAIGLVDLRRRVRLSSPT